MKLLDVQRDELLTGLRTLQEYGPLEEGYGICHNLEAIVEQHGERTADAYVFVSTVSVLWPGCSGRVCRDPDTGTLTSIYPIARTYSEGMRVRLWSGDQLRQRKELIAFLIDWLEQDASKQAALEE